MLEWLKRHDWKSCDRQNRFMGSNPILSAQCKAQRTLHESAAFLRLCLPTSQARLRKEVGADAKGAFQARPFVLCSRRPREKARHSRG